VNVIGHGVDLVLVDELRRWVDDPRNPFLPRCFGIAQQDISAVERPTGTHHHGEAVAFRERVPSGETRHRSARHQSWNHR